MTTTQKFGVFRFWFHLILAVSCIPLGFTIGGMWIAYYAFLMVWNGYFAHVGWKEWHA